MKTITQSAFAKLLLKIKGARAVSFSALCNARLKAPFRDVYCYSHINGMINVNYENAVNNQREREGKLADFVTGSLPYGRWHKGSICLIEQDGKPLQLRLKRECIYYRFYIRLVAGKLKILPYNTVKDAIAPSSINVKQRLNKEVVVRNYSLHGICFATVNKQDYRIR